MGQAVALQFAVAALSIATMVALPGCTLNDCPTSGQNGKCRGSSTELATCEPTESNSPFWFGLAPVAIDVLRRGEPLRPGRGTDVLLAGVRSHRGVRPRRLQLLAERGHRSARAASRRGASCVEGARARSTTIALADTVCPPTPSRYPDPVCAARAAYTCTSNAFTCSTTCVDNAVYNCNCGLRLSKKTDCGGVCVTVSSTSACALSDTPDPLCMDPDIAHGSSFPPPSESGEGWSQYCEQGELVECLGEFQVQRTPCQECLWGTCSIFGDAGPDAQGD